MLNSNPNPFEKVAAIDMGSNSFHLIVAEINSEGHLHTLDTYKEVLRLDERIGTNRIIEKEVIEQAVATLKRMQRICTPYDPKIRAIATHAIRNAKNHPEFIEAIKDRTGIKIEIIDGLEEARLCFIGMRSSLYLDDRYVLGIDIGGGSTEIIIAKGNKIEFVSSLKLGAVGLTERFLKKDSPSSKDIKNLKHHVFATVAPVANNAKDHCFSQAVACSGTVKAIAGIHSLIEHESLLEDPNGYRFDSSGLKILEDELIKIRSPKKIRKKFHLENRRSEIITAGTIILRIITDLFSVNEWTVSKRGLREGIALDSFAKSSTATNPNKYVDIRWKSILSFGNKMGIEKHVAEHHMKLSLLIYKCIESHFFENISEEKSSYNYKLLQAASYLAETGKFIGFQHYHKHSFYLISQGQLLGFSQEEKYIIGYIARFSRKGTAISERKIKDRYFTNNRHKINILSTCLRLAMALNKTRQGIINHIDISIDENTMKISAKHKNDANLEAEQEILRREQKSLSKAFAMGIEYEFIV